MNELQYHPSESLQTADEKQMGLFLHLSQLVNLIVPMGGVVVPILIWQLKKEEIPGLDAHGKMVTNWIISSFIYMIVSIVLAFVLIGFLTMLIVAVLAIVFPIVGAMKANNGELWEYPLTIKFIK